jgi:RNA polymerase sigma-70 factor, ECF subfamily
MNFLTLEIEKRVSIPSQELNSIIRAAQKGEEAAVTTLYQRFSQVIYRYIAYRVPIDEAEDLTAEVFINMIEALPRYRISEAPFEAWLYRIASARVADYHRRFTRHPTTELLESTPEFDTMPEEQLLLDQEAGELRAALGKLSQEQQEVLLLRFVNHKSHEEVSQIINKSVSAVKTIQHRALTQLATLLGSEKQGRHYLRGRHD